MIIEVPGLIPMAFAIWFVVVALAPFSLKISRAASKMRSFVFTGGAIVMIRDSYPKKKGSLVDQFQETHQKTHYLPVRCADGIVFWNRDEI